eukprot:2005210-Amphidinium_carterae.1
MAGSNRDCGENTSKLTYKLTVTLSMQQHLLSRHHEQNQYAKHQDAAPQLHQTEEEQLNLLVVWAPDPDNHPHEGGSSTKSAEIEFLQKDGQS